MISSHDIFETINMIDNESLDVRTITMGISLLDYVDSGQRTACDKVCDKICRYASNLVKTGEDVGRDYSIPIINRHISVTPISMIAAVCPSRSPAYFAWTLDRATKEVSVNFIGGYFALVYRGLDPGNYALIGSIPEVLSTTSFVRSSVNVGTTRAGINMGAVGKMGRVTRECTEKTADRNCIGTAKLMVLCNASEDSPLMAGALCSPGEPDCMVSVSVSGPGMVRAALAKAEDCNITGIVDLIKETAFKITHMEQLIAQEASHRLFVPFGIVDLFLAPTPTVGDSVACILEEMSLEACDAHGTTAALALLNGAVKKSGIMTFSHVGSLSGAFIPVTEDAGMIEAMRHDSLILGKLEATTTTCSVGFDMIAVPGDTPAGVISGIIANKAVISMVNNETATARLIPAIGKQVGEKLSSGGLLGGGPVMKVNRYSPQRFTQHGGHIPAPLQSLKN